MSLGERKQEGRSVCSASRKKAESCALSTSFNNPGPGAASSVSTVPWLGVEYACVCVCACVCKNN